MIKRIAIILVLAAMEAGVGAAVVQEGGLPPLLFETERPTGRLTERSSPLFVSVERATRAEGTLDVDVFGEFVPRGTIRAIESADEVRDEDGACRFSLAIGHGGREYGSFDAFLRDGRHVLVGEIVSRQVGFLFGRPATFYGLRIDRVLRSTGGWRPLGRVVYVPHLEVSIKVASRGACYKADSYPEVPQIGRRAAVRMDERPVVLGDESGSRYQFAGVYLEGSFWFETDHGSAYVSGMERVIDPPPWRLVERRLVEASDSTSSQ